MVLCYALAPWSTGMVLDRRVCFKKNQKLELLSMLWKVTHDLPLVGPVGVDGRHLGRLLWHWEGPDVQLSREHQRRPLVDHCPRAGDLRLCTGEDGDHEDRAGPGAWPGLGSVPGLKAPSKSVNHVQQSTLRAHNTCHGASLGFPEINGWVQERRNSSALALELRLSCTHPWKCSNEVAKI